MAQMVGFSARTLLAMFAAAWALSVPAQADDFVRSALRASGADAKDAANWQAAYDRQKSEILTAELLSLPPPERLAAIQQALHERILTGKYRREATDLRITLGCGDYNCLSATALCYDLCRAAGVELEIWSRPGHVWLQTADGEIVEPLKSPSRANQAAGAEVLLGRRITPQALLGKFYYNRGVQLLEQQQYAAALELLRQAAVLDPQDQDARENLLAGLNNWAAEHLRARRYSEAAKLIRQGLAIEPAYGPLVANQRLLPGERGR